MNSEGNRSFIPPDVADSNKEILMLVGRYTERYKRETGLSDNKIGKMVGCSDNAIFKLRKGTLEYCGISLLSRISVVFGFSLLGLLDEARNIKYVPPVDVFGKV